MADPTLTPWSPSNPAPAPIPSPAAAGVYMRVDDNVRITTYNSAAGVVLSCRSRMLDLQGGLQASNDPHTPNTDRTAKSLVTLSDEGWLIGGQIAVTSGTPIQGQCFVVVEIVRGQSASGLALQTIAAGYVTAKQPLAFPSLSTVRATDGAGVIRSITGSDPAAGAEISETVPAGARWRFIALRASLVTDATVQNRVPVLTFDDGANPYAGAAGNFNQGASLTFTYHFAAVGQSQAQTSTGVVVSAPANIVLLAGHRIRTITGSFQPADNWGAPQYLVEEWIEGA